MLFRSPTLGANVAAPPPLSPSSAPELATTHTGLGQQPLVASSAAGNTIPVARPDKRTPMPNSRVAAIFGERLVSERSLDDVILSYLAEDLGEKPRP